MELTEPAASLPSTSRMMRWLLIAAGSLFVAIGTVGIFLPLLPTTVFFLIAAGCYGKSSPGAYRWLTQNRFFGRYLRDYREERGASVATKILALVSLWGGMLLAIWLVTLPFWLDVPLLAIAAGVSVHLLRLRTIRAKP